MRPIDAPIDTARTHGARILLAAAQAAGWLPPGDSAIVSVPVADGTAQRLRDGGVVASVRAGRLRCAFHLSTGDDDVDKAAALLAPHVLRDRLPDT